jgi:hypothetical protein
LQAVGLRAYLSISVRKDPDIATEIFILEPDGRAD